LQHAGTENAVKTGRRDAEIQDDPDRADRRKEAGPSMGAVATRIDESEVRRLAELVARLSPVQQQVVSAVTDGFRAGWLDPLRWERYWRASDLSDEAVLGDAMTWLARRRRAAGG
jgi:hypothetical protein